MNLTRYITEDYEFDLPKRRNMKGNFSKKDQIFKHKLRNDKKDYHYSDKVRSIYNYIYNFIDSRIGLKYDDIYSEFCKKIPYWISGINTREEFNRILFDREYLREPRYYIDDKGILKQRSLESPVKAKPIIVPTKNSTTYYKVNRDYFRLADRMTRYKFGKVFGMNFIYRILLNEYISAEQYNHIYTKITNNITAPLTTKEFLEIAFERCEQEGKVVWPGDPDYTKYLYEQRQRLAKEKKMLEKQRKESFNDDLKVKKRLNRRDIRLLNTIIQHGSWT